MYESIEIANGRTEMALFMRKLGMILLNNQGTWVSKNWFE